MSFGRRRFDRIVLVSGEPHARFLGLDLGTPAEILSEAQLRTECEQNRYAPVPRLGPEEECALAAFKAFAKNPQGNPVRTAAAQQQRARDRATPPLPLLDPLSTKQRAVIERFRKLVGYPVKPTNKDRETLPHYDSDLGREVLAICDEHFPKGS